jgi:hypothetical protein
VALNTISLNPIMDWIRLEMFDLEQITTTHNGKTTKILMMNR